MCIVMEKTFYVHWSAATLINNLGKPRPKCIFKQLLNNKLSRNTKNLNSIINIFKSTLIQFSKIWIFVHFSTLSMNFLCIIVFYPCTFYAFLYFIHELSMHFCTLSTYFLCIFVLCPCTFYAFLSCPIKNE